MRLQWHFNIWPWVTLKGQIQGHPDLKPLDLVIYGESKGTNRFDLEWPWMDKVKVIQVLSDRRALFCKYIFHSSGIWHYHLDVTSCNLLAGRVFRCPSGLSSIGSFYMPVYWKVSCLEFSIKKRKKYVLHEVASIYSFNFSSQNVNVVLGKSWKWPGVFTTNPEHILNFETCIPAELQGPWPWASCYWSLNS